MQRERDDFNYARCGSPPGYSATTNAAYLAIRNVVKMENKDVMELASKGAYVTFAKPFFY
jgi:hypothetical protein